MSKIYQTKVMVYSEAPFRPICNHILIEKSPSNLNKTLKHYVLSHTTKNLYMNHFLTFKKVQCSKLQSQELTCILFKTGTTSLKVHNLKRVFCQRTIQNFCIYSMTLSFRFLLTSNTYF